MTIVEHLKEILEKKGVNIGKLEDNLLTTCLEAYAAAEGVDVTALPDKLATTYYKAILQQRGVKSPSGSLKELAESYGANNLPDGLVSTYLKAISELYNIKRLEFIVTGTEAMTFRSELNLVYYKNSDLANIPHKDIIHATCTHFDWGDGSVVAEVNDGEFIFNYTVSSGVGTGNVSLRNDKLFTSSSEAKNWFKEQVANGTPVTIVAYIR